MLLITGCARSGTSVTSAFLRACGAEFGKVNVLNENTQIRDGIVKPYLISLGYDPLGQSPLPNIDKVRDNLDPEWRDKILKALDGATAYKGAKMCLMWPQWVDAFPTAKWVIVRREDSGIIDSCIRTSFMRAYNTKAGWQSWINEHMNRFNEMHEAGLDCYEFWPGHCLKGNWEGLEYLCNQLGLRFNQAECAKQINHGKFRQ